MSRTDTTAILFREGHAKAGGIESNKKDARRPDLGMKCTYDVP